MRPLFYQLLTTLTACFRGASLAIQLIAAALTYVTVMSGADWAYFVATRAQILHTIFLPALIIGGLFPIGGSLLLLAVGHLRRNAAMVNSAWAVGQSVLLGISVSSFYKAFTGRLQPNVRDAIVDISHTFRFGVLRGGVFWGWPSSHTTIAFAMAVTIGWLYRKHRVIPILAIIYALYIGIGVATVGIHWLSEAVAGTLIGSVIGIQVGKSFEQRAATSVASRA